MLSLFIGEQQLGVVTSWSLGFLEVAKKLWPRSIGRMDTPFVVKNNYAM